MARISFVVTLLLAACGARAAPVPRADAQRFVEGLVETAKMDADQQPFGLAMACAEVSSCAGTCGDGLKSYVAFSSPVPLLETCDEAARAVLGDSQPLGPWGPASDEVSRRVADYLRHRTAAYADRARAALDADGQAELDRARGALRL
jgi:hypothetical protein